MVVYSGFLFSLIPWILIAFSALQLVCIDCDGWFSASLRCVVLASLGIAMNESAFGILQRSDLRWNVAGLVLAFAFTVLASFSQTAYLAWILGATVLYAFIRWQWMYGEVDSPNAGDQAPSHWSLIGVIALSYFAVGFQTGFTVPRTVKLCGEFAVRTPEVLDLALSTPAFLKYLGMLGISWIAVCQRKSAVRLGLIAALCFAINLGLTVGVLIANVRVTDSALRILDDRSLEKLLANPDGVKTKAGNEKVKDPRI